MLSTGEAVHVIHTRETHMPALGLGTWQLEGERCASAVREALELGYRHIDTAEAYGNESEIGAALHASGVPREDVYLVTKLSIEALAYAPALRAAEDSLARLGTGYVDLLYVHWPSADVPLRETLDALLELRSHGRTLSIGVSNFPPALLEEAATLAPIAAVQVEYHPYLAQPRLLELADRLDLVLTAYCPLARGRVLDDPVIGAVAAAHERTPAQVALRWLLQQPRVAAIPKAGSRAHLEENLDVFDFELDPQEMRRIAQLARGQRLIDPAFAPDWHAGVR